jgi:hypothetical protein
MDYRAAHGGLLKLAAREQEKRGEKERSHAGCRLSLRKRVG